MTKLTKSQQQKHNNGMCLTMRCMKVHAHNSNFCWSCIKKRYIAKHPLEYAYNVNKQNAKRRGKKFTLTFRGFKFFAEQNNYMNKKGTKSKSLQMDRIIEEGGYEFKNIQAITLKENIYKYAAHKRKALAEQAPF